MLCYAVNKGVDERSVVFSKAFTASAKHETYMSLNPIHQHRLSAAAAAASSALICMDYGEAFQSTERARAKEDNSSGVERGQSAIWRDAYSR